MCCHSVACGMPSQAQSATQSFAAVHMMRAVNLSVTGDESSTMNPWIAKAVILAASIVMVAIRAPHGQRSRGVKVVKNRKGRQEVILLTLAWLGFFVPLVWVASPAFSFAEYSAST